MADLVFLPVYSLAWRASVLQNDLCAEASTYNKLPNLNTVDTSEKVCLYLVCGIYVGNCFCCLRVGISICLWWENCVHGRRRSRRLRSGMESHDVAE